MINKKKHIVLGVTASIAAYKIPQLVRNFKGAGFTVQVIMTDGAKQFVAPMALEIVSESPVYCHMFESPLAHIDLTNDASCFLVAPATLNTIGKFAGAIADNLLTTALMGSNVPVVMAPAMNCRMYENPLFKDKVEYLKSKGVIFIESERGYLACGQEGIGRMAELDTIYNVVRKVTTNQDMAGLNVLVTAGPTHQYIDPIRFIANGSSGKMGFALAAAAYYRGARVTLISGPVSIPMNIKDESFFSVKNITSAGKMEEAVMEYAGESDIIVMAAAVGDYKPLHKEGKKIERKQKLTINLEKTNDIIGSVPKGARNTFKVGFSLEVGNNISRAREKLVKKGLDMIVFNDLTVEGAGFEADTNVVTIITESGEFSLPKMPKEDVAFKVYDKILQTKNLMHI